MGNVIALMLHFSFLYSSPCLEGFDLMQFHVSETTLSFLYSHFILYLCLLRQGSNV